MPGSEPTKGYTRGPGISEVGLASVIFADVAAACCLEGVVLEAVRLGRTEHLRVLSTCEPETLTRVVIVVC